MWHASLPPVDGHRNRTSQTDQRTSLTDLRLGLLPVFRDEGDEEAGAADHGMVVVVVEHLRLQVPGGGRAAWLQAELETWDPWLRQQRGFVEREVLWDSDRQEGVLLIHWADHNDWKAITASAVAAIQERFEAAAKRILALPPESANPFPLVFAGEVHLP